MNLFKMNFKTKYLSVDVLESYPSSLSNLECLTVLIRITFNFSETRFIVNSVNGKLIVKEVLPSSVQFGKFSVSPIGN